MTFENTQEEFLRVLSDHAGVGLWDAVFANGEPFDPASLWSWSARFRRLPGYATVEEFPNVVGS